MSKIPPKDALDFLNIKSNTTLVPLVKTKQKQKQTNKVTDTNLTQ